MRRTVVFVLVAGALVTGCGGEPGLTDREANAMQQATSRFAAAVDEEDRSGALAELRRLRELVARADLSEAQRNALLRSLRALSQRVPAEEPEPEPLPDPIPVPVPQEPEPTPEPEEPKEEKPKKEKPKEEPKVTPTPAPEPEPDPEPTPEPEPEPEPDPQVTPTPSPQEPGSQNGAMMTAQPGEGP